MNLDNNECGSACEGSETLFDPTRRPATDERGFFVHPDLPGDDETDDARAWLRERGYSAAVVEFEFDAPEDLVDDYYDREDETAASRWIPSPPTGDDWILVAKFENDDGPGALFVRPTVRADSGARAQIDHHGQQSGTV